MTQMPLPSRLLQFEHLPNGVLVSCVVIVCIGWTGNKPKPVPRILHHHVLDIDRRDLLRNSPGEQIARVIQRNNFWSRARLALILTSLRSFMHGPLLRG